MEKFKTFIKRNSWVEITEKDDKSGKNLITQQEAIQKNIKSM